MIYNLIICMLFFFNFLKSEDLIINYDNSYIEYKGFHILHNWSARTHSFESNINCKNYKALNNNGYDDCLFYINTNVELFDSKNENRDSNMFDVVEGYLYPQVSFKSIDFISESTTKARVNGLLFFHGIEKELDINIEFNLSDNKLLSSAIFFINLDEYNIDLPSLLLFPIENKIEIEVHLEGEFK